MADLSAYNDYEEEFLRMSRELQNRISALRNQDDDKRGAERSQAELKSIETDLWQAKQQLADMETEVRGLPDGTRRELGNKISTYRDSINSLQKDLEKVKNRINRNSLMESGGGDDMRFSGETQAQRERYMRANERLAAGSDSLRQSQQTLEDTENMAMDISEELHRNRQTIHSIRSKGMHSTAFFPLCYYPPSTLE
eukprot:gb/GECG01000817.1/.p1 GENE.gb/GECG01000817.1/~~gb/GECG01000817.1/.p1  ORF type:complete len:197 (+),score=29.68 gb/GECG01000817.1/:1-591(+)